MPTGTKGNYEVGYGKPPRNAGFKRSDDVIERRADEPVTITENGQRAEIAKREAVIK